MISNFQFILANGMKTRVGEYLPSISVVEQLNNPSYKPVAYEWHDNGKIIIKKIDDQEFMSARLAPDANSVIVLQDSRTYGSDNVVVLSPSGEVIFRVKNPYAESSELRPGDEFEFYGVAIDSKDVVLHIEVCRKLPGKPYDAQPIYEARYDPQTWKLLKLEWKPWT